MFFSILLFSGRAFCQAPDQSKPIYDCFYMMSFNQLFEQGQRVRIFNSELIASPDKSVFFALPVNNDSVNEEESGNDRVFFFREDTVFKVTKFPGAGQLVFIDKIFSKKEVLYTDTLYPMLWNLEGERKMIDSLECFKATMFFKGRNYIAWYCPKLSVPNGPWKLGGLPGLIVEAYDQNNDLHFLLKKFSIITNASILEQIDNPGQLSALPSYPDYIKSGLAFLKRMKEQLSTQGDGDCLDCHSSTKVELHNWENVIH